ncbi:MAG: hypothetical protein ACE5E1_11015 [Phycisphaerae bacterium]
MSNRAESSLRQAYGRHDRLWRDNAYCYPVVSRRSGGLSIGINLNPDKACNFDCIYCQVDRATPGPERKIDLDRLKAELEHLLDAAVDRSLFAEAPFDCVPEDRRGVRDIAFSGDGEPTTFPRFDEAVRIAVEARRARDLRGTKLVLITDACYLTRPRVRAGLRLLDENNGEIWAKLDAGTEAYFQQVNRPNFPLSHVLANILAAARERPIVIQSLWMRVHGEPPPETELDPPAKRRSPSQPAWQAKNSTGSRTRFEMPFACRSRLTTAPHENPFSFQPCPTPSPTMAPYPVLASPPVLRWGDGVPGHRTDRPARRLRRAGPLVAAGHSARRGVVLSRHPVPRRLV